jgi:hypothetical protein
VKKHCEEAILLTSYSSEESIIDHQAILLILPMVFILNDGCFPLNPSLMAF